jgi:hypothetical protein
MSGPRTLKEFSHFGADPGSLLAVCFAYKGLSALPQLWAPVTVFSLLPASCWGEQAKQAWWVASASSAASMLCDIRQNPPQVIILITDLFFF